MVKEIETYNKIEVSFRKPDSRNTSFAKKTVTPYKLESMI